MEEKLQPRNPISRRTPQPTPGNAKMPGPIHRPGPPIGCRRGDHGDCNACHNDPLPANARAFLRVGCTKSWQ